MSLLDLSQIAPEIQGRTTGFEFHLKLLETLSNSVIFGAHA